MGNISVDIGDDYPLSGDVRNFEAYMFATTDKHIARHTSFDRFEIALADGSAKVITAAPAARDRKVRSAQLTAFNAMLTKAGVSTTQAGKLPTFVVYLASESGNMTETEWNEAYGFLMGSLMDWSMKVGCPLAICSHPDQLANDGSGQYTMQHFHVMYLKQRGKHNEPQDFLRSLLGND